MEIIRDVLRGIKFPNNSEQFKILTEKSIVGIYIFNGKSLVYTNPSFLRISGYNYDDIVDLDLRDFVSEEDVAIESSSTEKILSGEIHSSYYSVRAYQKSGKEIFCEIYKTPILYDNKSAVLGTIIDVTDRRHIEERLKKKTMELEELNRNLEKRIEEEIEARRKQEEILIQQSKLAAMGEMIGAIAHQWRQPISTLSIILQKIEMKYDQKQLSETFVKKSVNRGLEQISFMSKTIDDFRSYFNPNREKERFNIISAVMEAISLLEPQLDSHNIAVRIPKTFIATYVLGYLNEFKQVVINIINNAKDAIEEFREKVENEDTYQGCIRIEINKTGTRVVLSIIDNGGGIPSDQIERIMEPYYTTKEEGLGTGIGLYMSKTIIEDNMGGQLVAKNHKDGACFVIKLYCEE